MALLAGCAANESTVGEAEAFGAQSASINQSARYQGQVVSPTIQASNISQPTSMGPDNPNPNLDTNEYRVGPHDLIQINVFGVPELSGDVRVNARGFISMPLIGVIDARDLSSGELAARIEGKLAEEYLQNPHVTIFIKEYASQRFTIDGAINAPGIYAMTGKTTLLQGIALAGGLARLADSGDIRLFRVEANGERTMTTFDLDKIRTGERADQVLRGNDIVIVMRSGARVLLNDSLLRDTINLLNPFQLLTP